MYVFGFTSNQRNNKHTEHNWAMNKIPYAG